MSYISLYHYTSLLYPYLFVSFCTQSIVCLAALVGQRLGFAGQMSRPGTDTAYFEYVTASGVAVVTLDHYPVNSLTRSLVNGLVRSVHLIERGALEGVIKAVVLRGAGTRAFCAGADIAAFGTTAEIDKVELGRAASDEYGFEELQVPVIAAIQGFALGGGFELALGCHYRVMASTARVGLPEVNIGLLPGAQGTQRLPRLVGAEKALELILSGRHVRAGEALSLGIVDHVVAGCKGGDPLLAAAIKFAEEKALLISGNSSFTLPRISKKPLPKPADFSSWMKRMKRKKPGEPAPQAIIRCVQAACNGPTFEAGVFHETREFLPLISSPESRALRHMFFAERNGTKVPGLKAKPRQIQVVGIVGAGLMGGGIAMCCANVGLTVHLLDVDKASLDRGMSLVKSNYERSRSMSPDQKAAALARFRPTLDYASFAQCDLVVEAVFENMNVKRNIFRKLSQVCRRDTFLCSNTSALDVDELADVVVNPSRVMGTHFFSPANVMRLLENVRGVSTSDEAVASLMAWGKKIGKWTILVGNCEGFVGNRMVALYGAQARAMLLEGANPSDVDGAATRFGMRVGPLVMSDIVGLELGMPRGEERDVARRNGSFDPKTNLQVALVDAGRKGQRFGTGGYFDYDGKSRIPKPSPQVRRILKQVRKNLGVTSPRSHSEEEIVDRLILPMVNEGFKILEEGFARRPADIDVCYVHGYSFPRWKGGPMHWADQIGLKRVHNSLQKMGVAPSALLSSCLREGLTLDAYWKKHGADVLRKAGPPKRRLALEGARKGAHTVSRL